MPELLEMGACLGSDVPFFLHGGAAFVSGRGELVERISFPGDLWVVLAKPPFSSGTAAAFALLDRAREEGVVDSLRPDLSREKLIRSLEEEPEEWPFWNDFFTTTNAAIFSAADASANATAFADVYRALIKSLKDFGASFAGLSGAGSCCFGIFKTENVAERAVQELNGQGYFTKLTFFLAYRADPVLE